MRRIYWLWLACSLATVVGCGDSTPSGNPPPAVDSGKTPDTGDQDSGTPPEDRQTPPDVQNPPDTGEMPDVQNPPDTGKTPDVQVPDTGPTPCAMGEMRCNDVCVDVQSNNGNCGMCGNACSATQTCQMGTCRDPMMCPMGQNLCGTSCVNTQTDLMNCGSCGNACMTGQTCQAGVCQTAMMCPMGQTSCTGSCVDTQTDANNCGTCGTVCPMGQSCQTGMCRATTMCMTGQTACAGTCVDTMTDANNCGTCGTVCTMGQTCQTGMCRAMMCPTGQTLCGSACVNLNTDSANCGSCGRACAMGQTCQLVSGTATCMGTVMCPTGQTMCTAGCADLQSDAANCGMCGRACTTGQECRAGTCTTPRPTCMTGQTDCAPMAMTPTCVDLQTSNANCGACGRACPTGQTCTAGVCTCATGQTLCGRACVNLMTDNTNCGACGTACPMGQTCMAGMCRCATGQTACSGACVNTMTDNSNCGMCGRVCPMGQTCTAGACACPTGQTSCGTPPACVNTMTDRANCGRCGNACPTGQTCTAGACACPTGQTSCGTGTAATCVDLMTNAANCGRCGMACATGTSCMAGTCRGMPPANDTRAGATVINLAMPSQTISANTTAARNDTTSCRCTSGNDVFYRFTLTAPEVVYADTFGATWDTSLFLQDAAGANLAGTLAAAPNVTCNDDTSMAGFCPTLTNLQSQIAARLPAGTYYLVLSGCSSGTADIHFQHLPAGNGTSARIAPSATEQNATGTTSGTGSVASTCCSGGADNTHWWITCPGTAAQTFYASTCNATTGASLVGYDVEIAQYSALRTTGAVCNDDIGGTCGTGSSMTSTIPATSATVGGLNTLIADSCSGAGAYTIRYSLSTPCTTGSRCGTACVDTNTSVNNCGACDRRCATGNLCIAGTCIAPPANDLPANAVTLNLANPQTIITGVDTRAAVNNTAGTCGCTTGNDIFYNFTIPAGAPQLIYADTFGSNWDTSLFVQSRTGTNVTATGLPTNGLACDDDTNLAGCGVAGGRQSQILLQLNPGDYRLVISGCGTGGTTNLRFQHVVVGNGATAFLAAGNSTPGGTTSGTGRVAQTCGGGATGPENTYYWHTCPNFVMGNLTASTCGRATWDTVLGQRSPGRAAGDICNDDVGGTCGVRSSVTAAIPAGPGVHVLYVDGFNGGAGAFTMAVTRP